MKLLLLLAMSLPASAFADDLFSLSTTGSTSKLKAGERGTVVINFTLAEGAHVSDEAPLKVSLSGEHVKVDKPSLSLADSVSKKQPGEKYAAPRFEVGFVPEQGATRVEARLSFFVCTATQCLRQTRTMSVPLEVL